MKWITNMTFVDGKPGEPIQDRGQSIEDARAERAEWLADKIVGRPKGDKWRSVEELERQGQVGIYQP